MIAISLRVVRHPARPDAVSGPYRGDRRERARSALEGAARERFTATLASLLVAALQSQTACNRALGMPRRLQRHPLELRHGTQWWARHLAARTTSQTVFR